MIQLLPLRVEKLSRTLLNNALKCVVYWENHYSRGLQQQFSVISLV